MSVCQCQALSKCHWHCTGSATTVPLAGLLVLPRLVVPLTVGPSPRLPVALSAGAGFNLENELAEGPIYCEAINRVRGARGLGAVPPARRRLPPGGPGKGREGARRRRRSEAISLQRFKKIVKSAVDFHGDRMQLMFPFWSGCPLDG